MPMHDSLVFKLPLQSHETKEGSIETKKGVPIYTRFSLFQAFKYIFLNTVSESFRLLEKVTVFVQLGLYLLSPPSSRRRGKL